MTDDLDLGRDDPALSLALAMVVSSTAPLLLLNTDLSIIAASASFCRAYEIEPPVAGQQLFVLGQGEWNLPQLRSLMSATLSGDAASRPMRWTWCVQAARLDGSSLTSSAWPMATPPSCA